MDVRRAILLAVICAACALGGASNARADMPGTATQQPRRPNIIFILTDDLSWNLVQYMPNLQAMQRDGTTFTNYFVTDSLCCPSRSSIFTGRFPHNTGVLTNTPPDGGYQAFNAHGNEALAFSLALQGGGYKTLMLGKYLNGYEPASNGIPPGWTGWGVAGNGYPEFHYALNQNGRIVQYGTTPQEYLTDVVSGLADAFIHSSAPGPYFIEIATFAPHAPYIPAPRDADKFPGLGAPRTPAFGLRPGPSAPLWLKDIPPLRPMEIKKIDVHYRMRAQSVLAVDQMIGRIRATLAALGDNNTYLVFSSDNGYHMGEYSLRPGKMTPFDTDIRVPLIVVGPGVAKGQTVEAIVENVDLNPTFTALGHSSGATAPDGHSLVTLFTGSAVGDWRHAALIEHHRPGPLPNPADPDTPIPHSANPTSYAALRAQNLMYVEYEDGEVGYYDLTRDPLELTNVAPSIPAAQLKRLHDALLANKQCKGATQCWAAQSMTP